MQLTFTSQPALRIIHIGGYWRGLNDVVRQMMLGLCSTGAAVLEYNTDDHPQALDTESRVYDRVPSVRFGCRRSICSRQSMSSART
jgi:hypothetical protein